MEIHMEIFPGPTRKSEAESHRNIPSGHASNAEWKWVFGRVHEKGLSPISALIRVVDLPYGSIRTTIGVVDGMKAHGAKKVDANWAGSSWDDRNR